MWLLWVTLAILFVTALLGIGTWVAHDPWGLVELRKLPRSTVATAFGDADIRLVGIVRAIERGESCVLEHTITEERQHHGRHLPGVSETTWVRTGDELDASDFWLDDGTGRALVMVSQELVRLMFVPSRYAVETELGDRRSLEAVVMDGDRIAVCGRATWDEGEGGAPTFSEVPPEIAGRRLVIRARERTPIVLSDEPSLLAD